jgi:ferric-dicitrate binding protein FerR (iron transport regulator)
MARPARFCADQHNVLRIKGNESMDISEQVAHEAEEWFIKLIAAVRIEELWPDFTHWLEADPAHRPAFQAMERLWALLKFLPWSDGDARVSAGPSHGVPPR